MSQEIRFVLLGNDECLEDYARRGGRVLVVLQHSLHLSTEIADLQIPHYLSMSFLAFVD